MAERGQRRSARICALEASRAQQQAAGGPGEREKGKQILVDGQGQDSDTVEELPVRKRGRKKRKLRTVEEVVVSSVERAAEQATEIPKHEDHPVPSNSIQPSTLPSTSQKPEKRLCELIIDILQTRDTHGVFAGPVDDKVECYYDIIKQPMDFGTINTKLQNGMYTTLEDFKSDVLLISSNAMHFNEKGSFYFNQGQLNYRLAVKLFDAAKAHPENYEVVLSRLRPKHGKKPGSHCRVATNERRNRINNGTARRGRPCLYGSSSHRRNIQSSNLLVDRKGYENLSGFRDGRRSNSFEEESRRIPKPWNSFLNHNESISSTIYESSKQLVNVNRGGIGYEESLLRYVKDLGPTAQMVAKRRLLAYQVSAPNGQIASTTTQRRLNPPNNIINIPTSQNLFNNFTGLPTVPKLPNNVINISTSQNLFNNFSGLPTVTKPPNNVINTSKPQNLFNNFSALPAVSNPPNSVTNIPRSQNFFNKISGVPPGLTNAGENFDIRGALRGEASYQNQSSEIQVDSHFPITGVRDLKIPVNGMANSGNGYFSTVDSVKFDNNNPSAELASEMSQSKLLEYICSKNNISRSSALRFQAMMEANSSKASSSRYDLGSHSFGAENQAITTPGSSNRVNPVPKWNQSSLVSHSLGVEQNQARVAPRPSYGTSSALFGHVMEWNRPRVGSNSFGGENLVRDALGASSPLADPVLEWNRANSGSHTFSAGNQAMDAPGLVYGIKKSAQASLGSNSLSAENQEVGAADVVFGTKSAQASSVPDWNQHNLDSPFLGGENQDMDVSGGGYGVELTQGGSVPVPIPIPVLEWDQQRAIAPHPVIDMAYLQNRLSEMNSFDQNGFFQPEWRLDSVPEAAPFGQMGYCGRVQTNGHQAELSTLALLDNHQQPDLALQL